jgi:HSP20 family molecular chaperone IbpA
MDHLERTVAETGADSGGSREITRERERYAVPPVDIYETEDGLVVVADLPGVGRDGLSVQVEQGVLTIEGRQAREVSREVVNREFVLAPFFRQFRIAEQIDATRIRAALRNGVLTLELPRAEQTKPRQIPIDT